MIAYANINVSDLARSKAFYAAALAPLGYVVCREVRSTVGFGVPSGFGRSPDPGGDFWLSQGAPHAPRPLFAFNAETRAQVDAAFAAAIAAGATDISPPDLRPEYHEWSYACLVRDLDGYDFEFICHTPA